MKKTASQTIKLCGMMRQCDIEYANAAMPDYVGFVFADTRRRITRAQAENFRAMLHSDIQAVGVFVDADVQLVGELLREGVIELAQLHGHENQAYIDRLREICDKPLIKAVRVVSGEDIVRAAELDVEYLLLDTYRQGILGGTGERFDWNIIEETRRKGQADIAEEAGLYAGSPVRDRTKICGKPFFLAGGLTVDGLREAARVDSYGLDISTGIETDGYKDREKMIEAVRRIRNV